MSVLLDSYKQLSPLVVRPRLWMWPTFLLMGLLLLFPQALGPQSISKSPSVTPLMLQLERLSGQLSRPESRLQQLSDGVGLFLQSGWLKLQLSLEEAVTSRFEPEKDLPADFYDAWRRVLAFEGEWANDPDDPGGLTRWGLSSVHHPDLDLASLSPEDAAVIYYNRYWLPARCDDVPRILAFPLFDTAVNLGPTRAVELLQRAIGVEADGIFGPITYTELWKASPRKVFERFMAYRLEHYVSLKHFHKFGRGWVRRVAAILHDPYPTAEDRV